jgi:hypothetical protein
MNKFTLSISLFFLIFFYTISALAQNAIKPIRFKGKTEIKFEDVCLNKGSAYTDTSFNIGQFVCSPNFKEYVGEPIITESKDRCSTVFQYDPLTKYIIDLDIKFPDSSIYQLREILTASYGKPKVENIKLFTYSTSSVRYSWEDSNSSISLYIDDVAEYIDYRHKVLNSCTVLSFYSKKMLEIKEKMEKLKDMNNANKIKKLSGDL